MLRLPFRPQAGAHPDPWPLPEGVAPWARRILIARGLRALADGCVAVLLPVYLLALGLGPLAVGALSTITLAGSALMTLALGASAGRVRPRRLLQGAALLMAATGVGFAGLSSFWPLAVVALIGTLNPSAGDASVFLALEQAELAGAARGVATHTALFARYALVGSLLGALGALGAGLPSWLVAHAGWAPLTALRAIFLAYGAIGIVNWLLYRGAWERGAAGGLGGDIGSKPGRAAPLRASRPAVLRLAALFGIDSFASGLLVNALLATWLFERFGLSAESAGAFFFGAGLLSTASQLVAPRLARRFGLLNTMVFTHLPASLLLIGAALSSSLPGALACLLGRSALSQMDVPARSAFVMAVVTPPERVAAASFTAVPKSLAAAAGPSIGGALLAGGWFAAPLLACAALKIAYDLSLLLAFRRHGAGTGRP
jgi:hypothetical protein